MRTIALIAVLAAGCMGDLEETTGTVDQENGVRCPISICGTNSGEVARNGMWEASLYGETDSNKMALETRPGSLKLRTKPRAQIWDAAGRAYDLYVNDGRISGLNPNTGARIAGTSLIGAKLHVLASGQPLYHIRIDNVRRFPMPIAPHDPIEVYVMTWLPLQASAGAGPLCDVLEYPWDDIKDADQLHGMRSNETLVFEGDRIDRAHLTMSKNEQWDPSWFNFGCAGRTLAKLRLLRKTTQNGNGDWAARQAALKMLAADYCGIGFSFTRTGQRIRWKDDTVIDSLELVGPNGAPIARQVEARWNENGATCMDLPRLQREHPSVQSYIWQSCLPTPCYVDRFSTPPVSDLAGAKIVSAIN